MNVFFPGENFTNIRLSAELSEGIQYTKVAQKVMPHILSHSRIKIAM
jgi:hypothetical protein